jgi:Methyltransferase domain
LINRERQVNPQSQFSWAESLTPKLLKSPWWIGHIPFAFELIGRLAPRSVVELGTYSGSSFAAFCQAVQASGGNGHCYGVDLWAGDIHMGSFDEALYQEISGYVNSEYPGIATLIRKDFNDAASSFADGSIDLLHIDGTHTFEAVANDFHTWFPKLSDRSVVLFHDTNVTVENVGEPAKKFGVKRFFDSVTPKYPHLEFKHCYGLGVLFVGKELPVAVRELIDLAKAPEFDSYFVAKGAAVSKQFADMGIELPKHGAYGDGPAMPTPLWRRAVNRIRALMQ